MHPVPRCTHHIDRRQARNFMGAIHYADTHLAELGRPLNTFATVNFDHIDCPSECVSAKFEKLRDNHFVRWLRYEASAPAYYVWVVENHGGDTHVHWVVHIPKSLRAAFDTKLPEWLARVAGTIRCGESAIDIKPVRNLRGLGRYLLKGWTRTTRLGMASGIYRRGSSTASDAASARALALPPGTEPA